MDYHEDAPWRCAHGLVFGRCATCEPPTAAAVPEAQDGRLWGTRWSNGFVTEYETEADARAGMQHGTKDVTLVCAEPLVWKEVQ